MFVIIDVWEFWGLWNNMYVVLATYNTVSLGEVVLDDFYPRINHSKKHGNCTYHLFQQ
jgi:hypothetical protein